MIVTKKKPIEEVLKALGPASKIFIIRMRGLRGYVQDRRGERDRADEG